MMGFTMYWVCSQIGQGNGDLTSPSPGPLFSSAASPSNSMPYNSAYQLGSTPPPVSSSSTKISPAILIIIIILAIVFFISALLLLLVKIVIKHMYSSSVSESNRHHLRTSRSADAFQRQLQQLFHLHDSGLDQPLIDALPVFFYKEIIGLKEPFDCAVCLCEFSEQDKLRLLPSCNHAFHIDCIDTWLLSNSTCPLCRGTLYEPGFALIENPFFGIEDLKEEEDSSISGNGGLEAAYGQKHADSAVINSKRVFSVRLGKFRSPGSGVEVERKEGESSNSSLDARRCYSMGSYQYVVADSDLQVALCPNTGDSGRSGSMRYLTGRARQNGNPPAEGEANGKRINVTSKGESFSVSKIWLWPRKDKFPSTSETHMETPIANFSSANRRQNL